MGQRAKRKNHDVTRGFLKRWVNSENQLWIFDIASQKIESRSLDATFAIHDYLYVPEINGKRNDSAENWFSGAESELVKFISRLDNKSYTTPIKGESACLTILGLIGLSLRSAYDLKNIESHLIADSSLKEKIGVDVTSPQDLHRFIVENMVNSIDLEAKKFFAASAAVFFETKERLLVCDRPGADRAFIDNGIHFIPVGPNEFFQMQLGSTFPVMIHGFGFKKAEHGEEKMVKKINDHTISRARNWVVASSKEELEIAAKELKLEKVEQRKLKDKIDFVPLSEEERKAGLRIKE